MSMDTYGIIGFTTDNVGIDRRFYTGRTDTDPTLAVSYNERRVDVYLNGIKLVGDHPGNSNHDYDIDAQTGQGSSITLKTGVALVASDVIECIGYVSLSGNTVTSHNPTPTSGDGGFNEFRNIGQVSSDLLNVYLNGVLLDDSDYTSDPTTNSGTVTIGSPAITASDIVVIQVIGTLNNSNFVPAGGGTFSGNVAVTGDLTVDTDTLKVDATNNRVGIGTDDPQYGAIDIATDGQDNGLAIYEASNLGSSFRIYRDNNIGYIIRGTDATQGIAIDANGKVGVGGQTAPLAKLDIKGNTDTFDGMAKIYLTDNNSNSASRNWSLGNGGSGHGNLTFAVSASKDGNAGDNTATNAMVITSDGYVTKPNQPAFSATASYTNIPLNTSTTITLSGERFDVGGNLTSNTFTAPVTGKYLFTYMIYLHSVDSAHTTLDFHIMTSNRSYQQTFTPDHMFNSDTSFSVSSSIIADMDQSDTCQFKMYIISGTAQTDVHTDSQVSGCLLL